MSDDGPNNEFEHRINNMQSLLKKHDLDALLVIPGKNFQYLFKSQAQMIERLVLAIITPNSQVELICPAFEVSNFEASTPVPNEYIHSWEETENPYDLLKSLAHSSGFSDGRLGLSPNTPFSIYLKIQKILSNANLVDAQPLFKSARINKTETELILLRKANKFTAQGIEATFNQLKEGLTEKEISLVLEREMSDLSGEPAQFVAVQFGENSAISHAIPSSRKLKRNEVVLIDAGTSVEGYNGDITNTTFFGNPTKAFLILYDIVEEANHRAVNSAKAGALPSAVDAVARDYITSAGYGAHFTHRTGHGIGLDVHEDPYIVGNNYSPLKSNQVFSIEPGIYITGKFGIRVEDIVIATSKKGERAYEPIRRYWEK